MSGPSEEMQGVEYGKFKTHFHEVTYEVGGYRFKAFMGFTDRIVYKAVLGQYGFFDKVAVTFDLPKETVELQWK